MGPPACRAPDGSWPAASDHVIGIDVEVVGVVSGASGERDSRGAALLARGRWSPDGGERAGVDRKTARRYVQAALAAGLGRQGGECRLSDELIGAVIAAVRPARSSGHGAAGEALLGQEQQIRDWVEADLQLTNVHRKLARCGVVVPDRTLHRFAAERCGFGRRALTARVADGDPGVECQIDFARMGLINDPETGRRRWCMR